MSAPACFEPSSAPLCAKCSPRRRLECDATGISCADLEEYNELLGVAWQVAEAIARIRDPERRREVALSAADAFWNAFPVPAGEWFSDREFVRLCGVPTTAVA